MYEQYRTPEAEKFNALGAARDVGMMYLNPFYQYAWNPGYYSATKGMIRSPIDGQWMRNKAQAVRKFVPYGNKAVDKVKSMMSESFLSSIQKNEEVWFGSGPLRNRSGKWWNPLSWADTKSSIFTTEMKYAKGSIPSIPIGGESSYVPRSKGDRITSIASRVNAINKSGPTIRMGDGTMSELRLTRLAHRVDGTDIAYSTADRFKGARLKRSIMNGRGASVYNSVSRTVEKTRSGVVKTAKGLGKFGAGTGRNIGVVGAKVGIRGAVAAGKLASYAGVAMLAFEAAKLVVSPLGNSIVEGAHSISQRIDSISRPEMGGQLNINYISQGAATERQRALLSISKAQINGRSGMGREASFMHR